MRRYWLEFGTAIVLFLALGCGEKDASSDENLGKSAKARDPRTFREIETINQETYSESEIPPTPPDNDLLEPSDHFEGAGLESFAKTIQTIGPGSDRTRLILEILDRIAKDPDAYAPIDILSFFQAIDANSYPEDHSILMTTSSRKIIQNLGLPDSVELLESVESSSVRRPLAYAVGALLSDNPQLIDKKKELLDTLPASVQLEVFGSLGDRQHFTSATEVVGWMNNLTLNEQNRIAALEAALNSSSGLEPYDLIEQSLSVENNEVSKRIFAQGVESLYDKDSLQASEYLLSIKTRVPQVLFGEGAKVIANKLQSSGDFESAKLWREEADQ